MSSEIVPAPDGSSETDFDSDSDEDSTTDSDGRPPHRFGAMEGVRPFDVLDLRAAGNPDLKSYLIGGDYQISQFLASDKGHRHVTQLSPTPNSVKPLLDRIKEPSVLLLQGCTELLADFPFEKFKTLTSLQISGCANLITLPEKAISEMTQLQTLILSHLPFNQLPHDFFSNLTNLHSLVLSACPNLHSLPKFPELPALQCLDLSHLLIEVLPRNFFETFGSVLWVILRGCSKLRSLPLTARLQKLEVLDLSHCTALKEMEFFWHRKLQMLDLSYTALPRIPTLSDSVCLTHLFLRDIEVSKLAYLKRVSCLQVLDLSGAQNVRLIDRLQDNKDLVALDLSRTGIESIHFLSDLIHIRYLILRECTGLVELPALKRLTNLEVLDISGCEILGDLPEDLCSLENLKELNLSGCSSLGELREGVFDQMSCLEKLDLSKTNVNHLPSFANLANLRKLSLTGLELDSLESLASLSASLEEVDLTGLNIRSPEELNLDFLECLENLRILNLSQTRLAKLPDMSKLVNHKELSLANCQELKVVSHLHLQPLKNLEILDLSLPDDYIISNFQVETESEAQTVQFLSAPSSLRKLLLANRPGVLKLFPLESLGKLEYLDLHGTDEVDPIGVNLRGMENLQEVVGWDGNIHHPRCLQGKISKRDELHLVSTFMSNSGFERFEYEFTKVDDLISSIQNSFKSASPAHTDVASTTSNVAVNSVANGVLNIQNQALKMHTDMKYILENIDLLESSRHSKSSEGLLHELMDAATHLSADDFPLGSTNLNELHRVVVKLKLLLPPKQVDDLKVTKEEKIKSRFTKSMKKEKVVTADVKDPQINPDLLSSYKSLTEIEKNCLLCFTVFPCSEGSLDENTGSSKSLVIKKRILIHWWFGEGFIDPQHVENPKPTPNQNLNLDPKANSSPNPELASTSTSQEVSTTKGVKKPKTIEEIGEQIFKVLEEKGFIEPVMIKRRVSGSCCMQPFVHSFVTARAKEEGFFDFNHKNGKLTPYFARSRRACLLNSQGNFPSSCNLWANYTNSPENLKIFKAVCTLFNVNDPMLYIKAEGFSKMKDLHVLHLGNWHAENVEHIEVVDQKFLEELKNMKQLRLLSLQGFSTIRKLPDSVCKLANLKILNLRDCTYLEELPIGIGSLKSLTHLDLTSCPILYKLPKGVRLLSKLEVLKGFVITYEVGGQQHRDACALRELLKLENLRKLTLVVNIDTFPDSNDLQVFKEMKSLCNLEISWEKSYNISQAPQDAVGLETLRRSRWQKLKCWEQQTRRNDAEEPLRNNHLDNLTKLVLYCFPSEIAPNWLDPSKLPKLEKLCIVGGNLITLPGDTTQNTWNVKMLRLKYLRKLYSNWPRLRGMFPCMTYFEHHQCDQLTLFPPGVWVESDEKKPS